LIPRGQEIVFLVVLVSPYFFKISKIKFQIPTILKYWNLEFYYWNFLPFIS
jgi:hypothetical protein